MNEVRVTALLNKGKHCFILDKLLNAEHDAYIIGGCVRDAIMNKPPHDWDICTSAKPEEVEKVFSDYKIIETGLKHGTVTVIVNDEPYEITTFRTEDNYTDGRHPDKVEFVSDIKEDLARRDFAMNAIAYNSRVGFVDPFCGATDIENNVIRCVGDPEERFHEDALRILRALRFSSILGFQIEYFTKSEIHNLKNLLMNISAERIQSELCKMLLGDNILNVLLEYSDVMNVILPELGKCIGFEQNNKYHQYTVYNHIAHAVANYRGTDTVVKVALLLHDIGKPDCYTQDEGGHGHFYGHAELSAKIADEVLRRLKFDNETRNDVVELIASHDAVIEPTVKAVRRWLNKLGEKQFIRLMDIRLADIQAHAEGTQSSRIDRRNQCLEIAQEIIRQNQCFKLKDLQINGSDILYLGVPEGPEVGRILNNVLNLVVDGELENTRDTLFNFLNAEILPT